MGSFEINVNVEKLEYPDKREQMIVRINSGKSYSSWMFIEIEGREYLITNESTLDIIRFLIESIQMKSFEADGLSKYANDDHALLKDIFPNTLTFYNGY